MKYYYSETQQQRRKHRSEVFFDGKWFHYSEICQDEDPSFDDSHLVLNVEGDLTVTTRHSQHHATPMIKIEPSGPYGEIKTKLPEVKWSQPGDVVHKGCIEIPLTEATPLNDQPHHDHDDM